MKILLAEDHVIVRQAIRKLLEAHQHEIVAEVDHVAEIANAVTKFQPNLLLLDYKMPGGDTGDVAQRLKRKQPELKIILLTGIQSGITLHQLSQSNLDGLLLKEGSMEELLEAIQVVQRGKRYISEKILPYLDELEIQLTGRELQILNLIAMGFTRTDMVAHLHVSAETIKSHRKNIMQKLSVHTVAELIMKAQKLNLVGD